MGYGADELGAVIELVMAELESESFEDPNDNVGSGSESDPVLDDDEDESDSDARVGVVSTAPKFAHDRLEY